MRLWNQRRHRHRHRAAGERHEAGKSPGRMEREAAEKTPKPRERMRTKQRAGRVSRSHGSPYIDSKARLVTAINGQTGQPLSSVRLEERNIG
jgi:hypothetical protein